MHCAVCHGNRGQGGLGGPLDSEEWQHAPDDASRARIIADGLPDLGMQAYKGVLSEQEIRSLVIFIRELQTLAGPASPVPDATGVHRTQRAIFRVETVAVNPGKMWGVTFAPDGRFLVTEIEGALRWIDADGTLHPPVEQTPASVRLGQGGMLDVALDPDYAENGWIYLVFAHGEDGKAMTSLVRGRIRDNHWQEEEVLFRARTEDLSRSGAHFGSRIVFQDDYVFFSIGDRGAQQEAQNLERPNGKIFRLHRDGRIPADNPFTDQSPYPAIWSYGHRNPQALAFRPGTDELWSTEHGPRGGDELNQILQGRNYGWPRVTFGMNYNGTPITEHTQLPGMEPPVWHWTPSIAVCGMAFVQGGRYPDWQGDLMVGGLRSEVLERIRLKDHAVEEREVVLQGLGRVRDVKQAPDGTLYLILESKGSRLVRLIPVTEN
jgi:glucose/arabinose dehydrogenase